MRLKDIGRPFNLCFSLADKLKVSTGPIDGYHNGSTGPRDNPIVTLVMVSVLGNYRSGAAKFPVKQPSVGLFDDLEVRMVNGPLLAGEDVGAGLPNPIFLSAMKLISSTASMETAQRSQ